MLGKYCIRADLLRSWVQELHKRQLGPALYWRPEATIERLAASFFAGPYCFDTNYTSLGAGEQHRVVAWLGNIPRRLRGVLGTRGCEALVLVCPAKAGCIVKAKKRGVGRPIIARGCLAEGALRQSVWQSIWAWMLAG